MPKRRVWAAVPFKGPLGSKRRLAELLDEDERSRLSLAMLDDVLEALLAVPGLERVLLLRPTATRHVASQSSRLTVISETDQDGTAGGRDGLNRAIRQAQQMARVEGAASLLIVPADLPLLAPTDVRAIMDAAETAPVVIAPDHAENGTNALQLTPPGAVEPSFGEASFERHRRLAEEAGLRCAMVQRYGLGLDLDTPADVSRLLASGRDSRATRLLRELDVSGRIECLVTAQARNTTI
jgi:2-phospho-L-lactate guanylyltransferase